MNPFTPVGKSRFIYFLRKIEEIVNEAEISENPARLMYSKDMRTPLFMLEALSRIYKKIHSRKTFKKLNKEFKDLEDRIGQIDFYDGFYKEFVNEKNIPLLVINYEKSCADKKTRELNEHLEKKNWIGKHKKRLKKVYKKLDSIKWFDEKNDTQAILKIYKKDIEKITKNFGKNEERFIDIENDVHELRRQLRWLSIYPQALLGLMQFNPGDEPAEFLKKYLTLAIIHSPFNKMPDGSGFENHITLNQNYYYALSWMISELGKLKDQGLKIELLEESILKVYKANENVSQLAYSFCDDNHPTLQEILLEAHDICYTFFKEDILNHIVAPASVS